MKDAKQRLGEIIAKAHSYKDLIRANTQPGASQVFAIESVDKSIAQARKAIADESFQAVEKRGEDS